MTNREKYANDIIDLAIDGISLTETCGISNCYKTDCDHCVFQCPDGGCLQKKQKWLKSEYKEPKHFTEEEKQLIKLFDKVNWVARNKDGELYGFINKPYKNWDNDNWIVDDDYGHIIIDTYFFGWEKTMFTNLSFDAIKWEDKEPTSREEILGN